MNFAEEEKNRIFFFFLQSNRLKPRGYYGLHRKGPIDLEKYKLDQGTSQNELNPQYSQQNQKKS